ncbi:hypothetical protein [Paracidobacterium acidisoli]|nr:hypothetical protein [Paracidobacterium acidisoli]MBT9332702.1 hypothetical protein [Paracidobacterium acidisoli]
MKSAPVSFPAIEPAGYSLHDDPRWQLVQRIVASRQFARAPLLSKFLLFVCTEMLQGRQEEISEYQIGVTVFDRPHGYRTVEDNIVRNYARQLRKRLAEYFAADGLEESFRVEIPLGGYVPAFAGREPRQPKVVSGPLAVTESQEDAAEAVRSGGWRKWALGGGVLLAYSAILVWATMVVRARYPETHLPPEPSQLLWSAMFHSPLSTFIVPADCGFNMIEDLSHRQISLADYLNGDFLTQPLPAMDEHSSNDLRTQEYTSFVDLEIVSALSRLSEIDPRRLFLRFPRDLRLDDLKRGNVVLIGSLGSDPWAGVAQKNMNFKIDYRNEMQQAWVINTKPRPGEAAEYVSHWNEPVHQTYAVIAYIPNLSGNGHILLVEGLDVAGTQAAAEMLLRKDALETVLHAASLPEGGLKPFEILLQSTSIESNAANTQIIASRIG